MPAIHRFSRIGRFISELRETAPSEIIYRSIAFVLKRQCFLKILQPLPVPDRIRSLSDFKACQLPELFPPKEDVSSWFKETISDEAKNRIINIAKASLNGDILCFSKSNISYGNPINWHLNPLVGKVCNKETHWSAIHFDNPDDGDVKIIWELNRFSHVYYLVRAYMLTGDDSFVRGFFSQLESWEKENPYGYGVNWVSGQELAIRVTAWVYALYNFRHSPALTERDLERIQKLIYSHAKHIERNIGYSSFAVKNNHLIGEALALFLAGQLFPWFDDSLKWAGLGRNLLENECLDQFFSDGGYCQSSHNYHRLAIHYYLWAVRIGEVTANPLSGKVYSTIDRSAGYLHAFLNMSDGRMPNWGPNDGALLNPWTSCDYSDFRPVIAAAYFLCKRSRIFNKGIWDEELLWFYGAKALSADKIEIPQKSVSFPVSGIHVLRSSSNSFCAVRCGTVRNRFGHSDQLHADLWVNGFNLVVDSGSYSYNYDIKYHRHFMGTLSHNTVTIDGMSQMFLHRRFKWINLTKANLRNFTCDEICGEHYGYNILKGKVTHRRSCNQESDAFLVNDTIYNSELAQHQARLHWLIDCDGYTIENFEKGCIIKLATAIGTYWVAIASSLPGILGCVKGGESVDGWSSRYYSVKTAVLSLNYLCEYNKCCQFRTTFTGSEVKARASLENTHFSDTQIQSDIDVFVGV